jgi:hypothetical protein
MSHLHKKNHYVPQLYLKQWATNGKIPTYRLLVPDEKVPLWKSHSLGGIAYHRHLYTYMASQGETDEIEQWLNQKFETPAEEAIRLAVNNERMSPEHWKTLVRFAFAQDVRTPANLMAFLVQQQNSMPSLMNKTLENTVKRLEEGTGVEVEFAEKNVPIFADLPIKTTITPTSDGDGIVEVKANVGRQLWLWQIRHFLTNTIEKISHRRWTILRAPSGISWPTSDNPLIKLIYKNENDYNFDGGWGIPKCDILLPLGPTHLLHNSIDNRSWRRGTVIDTRTAKLFRKIIIEHAHRYIFDKTESDVHLIRPRDVSLEKYEMERDAWENWHREQSEAEAAL